MKHIKDLKFWGPADVLISKYSFDPDTARMVESFILPCLNVNPSTSTPEPSSTHRRVTYSVDSVQGASLLTLFSVYISPSRSPCCEGDANSLVGFAQLVLSFVELPRLTFVRVGVVLRCVCCVCCCACACAERRATAADCLRHPWLAELAEDVPVPLDAHAGLSDARYVLLPYRWRRLHLQCAVALLYVWAVVASARFCRFLSTA